MKIRIITRFIVLCLTLFFPYLSNVFCQEGFTVIAKWPYDKKGAVSVTYDDGTINQFKIAVPIMDELKIPGTFFIVTGALPGSEYQKKFIGRSVKDIMEEARTIPANKKNFRERASAARFLGYKGASDYFTRAGAAVDAGRNTEAYSIMDDLYKKVYNNELPEASMIINSGKKENILTWDIVKTCASRGHEFEAPSGLQHMATQQGISVKD